MRGKVGPWESHFQLTSKLLVSKASMCIRSRFLMKRKEMVFNLILYVRIDLPLQFTSTMIPHQYIISEKAHLLYIPWSCVFYRLENKYHCCWIDNLYMSTKISKLSCINKNKLMVSGVARKLGRGIPFSPLQQEKNQRKMLLGLG